MNVFMIIVYLFNVVDGFITIKIALHLKVTDGHPEK